MRVPDALLTNTMINQLNVSADRLTKLQFQAASGKRIQKPSDDPGAATRAMALRTDLERIDQYRGTADDANSWLKSEESALGALQSTIRLIRNNALQGANSQGDDSRAAIATQIATLHDTLLQAANASDGLRYLFGGYQTTGPQYAGTVGAITYTGDEGTRQVAVSDGVILQLNHTGGEVFNMGGVVDNTLPDLFTTVANLQAAVANADNVAIQAGLQELDTHMRRITTIRGETGDRQNQVEMASSQHDAAKELMSGLLSNYEDCDFTEVIMHLREQENAYQAASYVSSTLRRGGLLDWLR